MDDWAITRPERGILEESWERRRLPALSKKQCSMRTDALPPRTRRQREGKYRRRRWNSTPRKELLVKLLFSLASLVSLAVKLFTRQRPAVACAAGRCASCVKSFM